MCAVGQKRTSRRFGTRLSNKSPVSAPEFEPGMLGPREWPEVVKTPVAWQAVSPIVVLVI